MNELVEMRLRKYQTPAPPAPLRGAMLSALRPRRSVRLQKLVLRTSMAFLALTLLWAYGMERGTATRMAVAMGVAPPPPAAESGIMARLLTPGPLLPLSPRWPAAGFDLMAAARKDDAAEGDIQCVY